jgi:hypothetical protein
MSKRREVLCVQLRLMLRFLHVLQGSRNFASSILLSFVQSFDVANSVSRLLIRFLDINMESVIFQDLLQYVEFFLNLRELRGL